MGIENKSPQDKIKDLQEEIRKLQIKVEELQKKTGYTTSLFSSTCNNCGHFDRD